MTAANLRVPPHSIEAEQSVLGGLLLDNQAWDRVGDMIADTDFYRDEHRRIFRQIRNLLERAKPADVITVAEALDAAGEGDKTGGLAYLGELAANTPSAANIKRYAEIVRERSVLRQLMVTADEISTAALNAGGRSAMEVLELATSSIMRLADHRHAGREPRTIDELLPSVIEALDRRVANRGQVSGLPTGFVDLDQKTSGFQPGDLIIVAGRPSMGKTTLAVNVAENVVMTGGVSVVISLEMSAEQLTERCMARFGSINTQSLRTGDLSEADYDRLAASLGRLTGKRLVIADDPTLAQVARIRLAARKVKQRQGGLDLIVIDYLQLMRGDGNNRNEELGGITRSLKLLARELACPIVALSQLSRKVEERTDKRPMMSDLRESGAIEQDADVILMMYRDDYYNKESRLKGYAEVLVRKQRMGPLGEVPLVFQGEFSRFRDADPAAWWQAHESAVQATPTRRTRGFDE
jgi:replicative DNA helicase